ncbi:MAG: hypothetical protein KIT84_37295 [Labilithrix sp.]|nr:hypothetical protein [Labilithrix sp.]MCW5816715.1 hypothetical protein [Labilithrix sp.]
MANERYVRPTIAGWIFPTLIAPWIASYASVAGALALGVDFGKWQYAAWVVGLVFAGVFAFTYSLTLILIDLLLLAVRLRTFSTGGRAWLSTMLSVPAIFGVYTAFPPHKFWHTGAWGVAAAVFVPMLVGALVLRVFAGKKPLK